MDEYEFWNKAIVEKGARKMARKYYCNYRNRTIEDAKRATIDWATNYYMAQFGKRPKRDQLKKLDDELNNPDVWNRD